MQGGSSGWQISHFSVLSTVRNVARTDRQTTGEYFVIGLLWCSQQPWQMPFIFAFMIASSSLIVSMYFALSTFDVGAARTTGLAAEDATGGAPLS
jgi:hypothetical protein